VTQRRLDEDLRTMLFGAEQTVLPLHVTPHALLQRVIGKRLDARAERSKSWLGAQALDLGQEPARQ
jgi:hypothetical protein